MSADLKLIFCQPVPAPSQHPLRTVDHFVFVRDGDRFAAMYNGTLLDPCEAAERMADIIGAYLNRAAPEKPAIAVPLGENELASTPNGLR